MAYKWTKRQKPRYQIGSSQYIGIFPNKKMAKKTLNALKNEGYTGLKLRKLSTTSKKFKNWRINA